MKSWHKSALRSHREQAASTTRHARNARTYANLQTGKKSASQSGLMAVESASVAFIADGLMQDFTMRESRLMLARLELSSTHAEWLEEVRKIPCEIAADLGFVSRGNDLAIEFRRNGALMFRKIRRRVRNEDGTEDKTFFIEPKGSSLFLFNEDCLNEPCREEIPLIICEGEIDAASWIAAGATRVVSVPNGAAGKPGEGDIVPSEDKQFAYLWDGNRLKPEIERFSKIILATDNDKSGGVLRDELAIRLGRSKCYVVEYPSGCKDANDVLQKHENGAEILMHMIDEARPIVPDRLMPLVDIPERGVLKTYSTGWGRMDDHMIIVPPELIIVTGTPNAGKSQWTLSLCMNLARIHGLKGAIFQFEDSVDRNRSDIIRYVKAWSRKEGDDELVTNNAKAWARRMFYAISPKEDEDDDVSFDLKWIQGAIHEAVTRHGCKWVLIDPWNEIEHVWNVRENETSYTNSALRELKRIARRYQIAVIIVTHPGKAADSKAFDDLSLYDVSGSAAWKNKADHGVIIGRHKGDTSKTLVKIDKCKDWRTMGRPGTVTMQFHEEIASFTVVED